MDWPLIGTIAGVILGSSVVASLVTGFVSWKVTKATIAQQHSLLEQQRLTENLTLMADLMALGHARDPRGARSSIGLAEQLGAIESVVTLGLTYAPLRLTARAYLIAQQQFFSTHSIGSPGQKIWQATGDALARFK